MNRARDARWLRKRVYFHLWAVEKRWRGGIVFEQREFFTRDDFVRLAEHLAGIRG